TMLKAQGSTILATFSRGLMVSGIGAALVNVSNAHCAPVATVEVIETLSLPLSVLFRQANLDRGGVHLRIVLRRDGPMRPAVLTGDHRAVRPDNNGPVFPCEPPHSPASPGAAERSKRRA